MPEPRDSALVIFDVCDTLYDANTTFGFLAFYAERSGNTELKRRMSHWTSLRTVRGFFGAVVLRLFGIDIGRARVIHALRGDTRDALTQSAHDYVGTTLPSKMNRTVHDRLRGHRDSGDRVVLLSSSLDIVIRAIAEILDVEFSASILEFANGYCTGRLQSDLTGRKAPVAASLRRGERILHVYTDNRTDNDLLEIADRRTVIFPAGSRQHRWAGADCEYVEL